MRDMLLKQPRLHTFLLFIILGLGQLGYSTAHGEFLLIPIQREIPTQPITKLEVISIIKSKLSGRVLSIKKQSTYENPDCHHVKFLADGGEFQIIQVGCLSDAMVQNP